MLPLTRALAYVNAGHNPPMVFRQADGGHTVTRLDVGGPVIGLMEGCTYRQGCVTLDPGDLLLAYTDGISEAVAPAILIERIMTAADAFVAGAPQHDDMTLVVLRTT
jgi:phosphoserine phosphatase RsbU/P